MGGLSAEREVSLRSGAACAEALEGEGYRVTQIDVGRDLAARLAEVTPDVCFNALHGRFGEDGCVQGLLEMPRHPLHALRRARVRAGHAQGARQGRDGAGRRAGRRRRGRDAAREAAEPPRAGAALCREAGGRRLQRRRRHRRAPAPTRPPQAIGEPAGLGRHRHGRALHPRPRADLRRDRRLRHRRHRDRAAQGPRASTITRRNTPPAAPARAAGRTFTGCLPIGPEIHVGRLSRIGLPRRCRGRTFVTTTRPAEQAS